MKATSIIVALLLLLCMRSFVSAQTFDWAKRESGHLNHHLALAADHDGNLIVFGGIIDSVQINGSTIAAGKAGYITKYSPSGATIWTKYIDTAYSYHPVLANKAETDAAGNIYLYGFTFNGDVSFLGDTIRPASMFLAKLSPAGTLLWLFQAETASYIPGTNESSLKLDPAGNIYITGSFNRSVNFGGTIVQGLSGPFHTAYSAKFNPNGGVEWVRPVWNTSVPYQQIQPLPNGDYALAHSYFGHEGIQRFDNAGSSIWSVTVSDSSNSFLYGIEADGQGNLYVFGRATDLPVQFGNTTITPAAIPWGSLFLAKLSSSGRWLWAKAIDAPVVNPAGFTINPAVMTLNPSGGVVIASEFMNSVAIGNVTLMADGGADTFIAWIDSAGNLESAQKISGSGEQLVSSLKADALHNIYVSGKYKQNASMGGAYLPANPALIDLYVAKINPGIDQLCTLSGGIFVDTNTNNTWDAGESAFYKELLVELQPGPYYYIQSSTNGKFSAHLNPGSYTLSLPNPPTYYTVSPATHTAQFTAPQQTDSLNYFALAPVASQQDLRVTLTPVSASRPGFVNKYQLTFENMGTIAISGVLKLDHDLLLQFQNSSLVPSAINGNLLSWTYQNLQPGERRQLWVNFLLPASVTAGTGLISTAMIEPQAGDLAPGDNVSTADPTVVNSVDPNDMQVDKVQLTPAQAAAGAYLTYTIRFQNTGTAPAVNARITDQLNQLLQVGSLEVLAASHPYRLQISGADHLEWRFDNINLPDSTANEPASHGFLTYRVRVKNSLQPGDYVRNQALIFFDFNAPVATNTVTTTVQQTILAGAAQQPDAQVQVYPNPARTVLQLEAQLPGAGPVQVQLLNLLGQPVLQLQCRPEAGGLKKSLSVAHLPAGLYVLQLQQGGTSTSIKVLLQD